MLKPTTPGALSRSLYPMIYSERPWEQATRIASELVNDAEVLPWLANILEAIDDCLAKTGWLDELGPLAGNHSEADIKRFLTVLRTDIAAAVVPKGTSVSRIHAGEACTRAGFWFSPAQIKTRHFFNAGDLMPSIGGD